MRNENGCPLQDKWQERSESAVELWFENSEWLFDSRSPSVGDLGCGNERLRDLVASPLGRSFTYQGYDLHPQSREVIKLDLRQDLPDREFDVVFALGLLEYLPDVEDFLTGLRRICPFAILSYVFLDSAEPLSEPEREERGWRNHYTRRKLEALCERAGWVAEGFVQVERGRTGIWLWRSVGR